MQYPTHQVVTLASLAGTWRRRWVRKPDGTVDATTRAWWVQSARQYGDLRIPRGRPNFGTVRSLQQCTRPQLLWLATQEGFAGQLTESGGIFHWWRDVDYQPFTGRRDVGRLTYNNAEHTSVTEVGEEEPYTELWERSPAQPGGTWPPVVTAIQRPGARGWFVGVGDEFILAVDRRPPLPRAESLTELVAATANLHHVTRYLDAEISFGRRDHDEGRNGTILASTIPWREGELAFPSA
jgi:hypothetical protein